METERRAVIGAWQAMALFVLVWIAVMIAGVLLRAALPHPPMHGLRDIVALRVATGLPLSWVALGGTVLILRARGQSLRDIGWGGRSTVWGWIAALAVAALLVFNSFRVPGCRGQCFIDPGVWMTDWSLFRTAISLSIGITAGICEETMFRGFVMRQARDAGLHWTVQALLSGVLFGLAHVGVAGMSGRFDPVAAVAVVAGTTVFGAVFGCVYLLGRRSLVPVIVAHGIFAFTTEPWLVLWGLAKTMH